MSVERNAYYNLKFVSRQTCDTIKLMPITRSRWSVGWGIVNLGVSLALIAGAVWVVLNKQAVLDWWALLQYKPSAAALQLANNTSMTGRGRDMFYVSDPQVQDSQKFNQSCSSTGEQTIVLGCYVTQHIYIFDVVNPQLAGVKEVTAAHEMLHAAYERLDGETRSRVNGLLQDQLGKIRDDHLNELVALYSRTEPDDLLNEMHSIIGTEYSGLDPELEQYYGQYFSDRSKVVAYAQAYRAIFTASQERIAAYDKQLASIKQQIDTNYTQLDERKKSLEQRSSELDQLRQSDVAAYNQAVPGYNAQVNAYNSLAIKTRDLVTQYNALVATRNNEAAAQNNLYQSLNSQYQPVPAQ